MTTSNSKKSTQSADVNESVGMTNLTGQLDAVNKVMAVIEFELDGTIIAANENFCNAVGYRLDEIQGQHHRIFCEASYTSSPEYKAFWDKLGRGQFEAGEYKRITKSGDEIWINASYNPIFDENGKPYKVVKFASDVTEQVKFRRKAGVMIPVVENAPTNIILADSDLNITYVNPATVNALKPLAHLLPVALDQVVGSNIDIFHKDPSYQRKILSNPKNLPHQAFIELGDEILDLLVSGIYDEEGEYVGPMVTWELVTEKRQKEHEAAEKSSMVENAPVNIIMHWCRAPSSKWTASSLIGSCCCCRRLSRSTRCKTVVPVNRLNKTRCTQSQLTVRSTHRAPWSRRAIRSKCWSASASMVSC